MTDEQKKTTWLMIAKTIGAFLVGGGLCMIYMLRLENIEDLKIEVIGAIVAAVIGLVLWDRKTAGGSSAMSALVAVGAGLLLSGCGAQHPAPSMDCTIERAVVSVVGAGIDVAEDTLDMSDESAESAITHARAANVVGDGSVDICEAVRDGADWREYLLRSAEMIGAIVALYGSAGPGHPAEPPPELLEAQERLEHELSIVMVEPRLL